MQAIAAQAADNKDPHALLKSVATKGGVTEAMVQCLQGNPQVSFEELLAAGMARVDKIVMSFS